MTVEGQRNYLPPDTLLRLVDELYDEVCIYDNNFCMVYVNKACYRHYGYLPDDLIGKRLAFFTVEHWWDTSILPHVYTDKKPYAIRQKTQLGVELLTIAIPIFDNDGNIEFVVMSVRDEVSDNLIFAIGADTVLNAPSASSEPMIYDSAEMTSVMDFVKKIAHVDANCILAGESGTGKTALARYMHEISTRSQEPFISVNCASLPSELIESELFGYTKGAFTGARNEGRKGLFEAADHGTLLLDEISEMPYGAQAKLLHVIQEKEFLPVGGNSPIHVDVKIIAATNKDLLKLVESGEFRMDLYYRLNVFEIMVPPLRQRRSDISKLALYFLAGFCKRYHKSHTFSPETMKFLLAYDWKGNVRELRHVVEQLTVMVDDMVIEPRHLPKSIFSVHSYPVPVEMLATGNLDSAIVELERRMVTAAYQKCRTTRALSEELGISQTRASKLIRTYITGR